MTSLVEVNQAIISLVVFDHHLSTTPEYEKLIIDIHADEAYNEIRDVISNNGQKYRRTDRRTETEEPTDNGRTKTEYWIYKK